MQKLVASFLLLGVVGVAYAATCAIDGNSTVQVIDGFGFSTAWCGTLTTAKSTALYETLGMNILRIRIDENQGWSDETNNAKVAHSYGATVMGTAWSPPPAWNSNGKSTGGYLLPAHYADYATYLKKAATSIGLDYISFQNEPDYGNAWVAWTGEEMHQYLLNYSTTIDTPIVYPESYHFDDAWSDPLLNDPAAVKLADIIGGHIYGAGNTVHKNAISKGKHVWMTEHYIDGMDDISAALQIAEEISECMNNQMSAYIWWWVYESDTNVNLVSNDGTIHKNGFTIAQFGKFITPGEYSIAATYQPATGVTVTAYGPQDLVIVAVNSGSSAVTQDFTLANVPSVKSLYVHRTSKTENMVEVTAATVADNAFSYTLAAQSITTFHVNE